ncbi:MAG TPA: two-component regulator propeller domain-containing protein, partial [Saprospiraceae bacterium]|nr:two-component regulator propeller domain-containing protein [Saprospiraceae bacterium]
MLARHFAILIVLIPLNLFGQSITIPHISYTTDDGLPSSEVYDVLQDRDGYMWFSTDNGLSRFDGYEFKNYGFEEGLTDLVVFDLQEDSKGRIWMNSLT